MLLKVPMAVSCRILSYLEVADHTRVRRVNSDWRRHSHMPSAAPHRYRVYVPVDAELGASIVAGMPTIQPRMIDVILLDVGSVAQADSAAEYARFLAVIVGRIAQMSRLRYLVLKIVCPPRACSLAPLAQLVALEHFDLTIDDFLYAHSPDAASVNPRFVLGDALHLLTCLLEISLSCDCDGLYDFAGDAHRLPPCLERLTLLKRAAPRRFDQSCADATKRLVNLRRLHAPSSAISHSTFSRLLAPHACPRLADVAFGTLDGFAEDDSTGAPTVARRFFPNLAVLHATCVRRASVFGLQTPEHASQSTPQVTTSSLTRLKFRIEVRHDADALGGIVDIVDAPRLRDLTVTLRCRTRQSNLSSLAAFPQLGTLHVNSRAPPNTKLRVADQPHQSLTEIDYRCEPAHATIFEAALPDRRVLATAFPKLAVYRIGSPSGSTAELLL